MQGREAELSPRNGRTAGEAFWHLSWQLKLGRQSASHGPSRTRHVGANDPTEEARGSSAVNRACRCMRPEGTLGTLASGLCKCCGPQKGTMHRNQCQLHDVSRMLPSPLHRAQKTAPASRPPFLSQIRDDVFQTPRSHWIGAECGTGGIIPEWDSLLIALVFHDDLPFLAK